MKKLFIYLSVAVLGIAAASCQKELAVAEGGKGNVTFTIQTPDAGTKAIADGTNVNVVYYEVYKAGSGHANSIVGGAPLIDSKIEKFTGTATLKLNLLQNQDYVVLFWAEVAGKSYYTTTDLRTVTVNYTGLKANDEARAAFCQKLEFNSSKTYSTKVTLVRPFAQINLGTTQNSIDPVVNGYNLDVESSYMKVVGAATTFSVATMTTGSETTTVEFAANTVPHDFTPNSEELKVNDVVYAYLGMNYILAATDVATVDVTYEINTNVGSISRQIPAVPVQTNYRTNLLGNLLTQETAIEIVVDEKFNTPDQEPAPIYMAAANGGEFTLTEDVELSEPLKIQAPLVLDLNGHTISASLKQEGRHHYAIDNYAHLTLVGSGAINARGVQNFGTMVIDGDITITNVDTNGGSAIWNEGDLVINNGTFTTNPNAGAGSYGGALSTQTGGSAVINGGNFKSYSQYTYAICNYGETIINDATVTAKHGAVAAAEGDIKTVINGGTFSLMENPGVSDHCLYYVSDIKGGTFTLGNNTDAGAQVFYKSTIAEGYKAVETAAGVYTVIPNSAVFAADDAAVEAALVNKAINTIYLQEGTYSIDAYANSHAKESLTIFGTEGTKVKFKNQQVRMALCKKNFTIDNCEILHMADKSWGMIVFGSGISADGVYTISNCTFNGVGTQGIYINEETAGAVYNIENCTFNGDFGGEGAVVIQNNPNKHITVNVMDCSFNNIPSTSHEICVLNKNRDIALNTKANIFYMNRGE